MAHGVVQPSGGGEIAEYGRKWGGVEIAEYEYAVFAGDLGGGVAQVV